MGSLEAGHVVTLTIGRVSIVQNPSQVELDGDRLDIAGWFFGTDLNNAKVLREQLLGLDGNEDEPDVPVTWTYDPKIDGYYTIKSVAVSHIIGVAYEKFKFQYAATFERIGGGFSAPLVEVSAALAVRTNGLGITVPIGAIGIPSASAFRYSRYFDGQIDLFLTSTPRVTATGDVIVTQAQAAGGFLTVGCTVLPADYYDGAVMIEQSVGGVFYPVVGDQIGSVVGNLLRIGNGLIRATFHTDGALTIEIFDGTVWESSTVFGIYRSAANQWQATGAWKVMRNDPAGCTIVTSVQSSGLGGERQEKLTINLERGRRMIEMSTDNLFYPVFNSGDVDTSMQLRAASATAATAITGGIRQTSNNAQGHRWIMACPSAVTTDLVNGRITIAAPGVPLVGQFGLGWEIDGSAAIAAWVAARVVDEFFAVTGTRQRVVAK